MLHVLRLGHRIHRDERITTHVCLTARAFGAQKAIITGEKDTHIIDSVEKVTEEWGGPFSVEYSRSWKTVIREYKDKGWLVVHLTMYGINLPDVESKLNGLIKSGKNMLIVIGGAKVPSEVYQLADYNVAVTNQPHSEVAALAVFLDHLFESGGFSRKFANSHLKIIPTERGKRVEQA